MKEFKSRDKLTQRMTRDGAVLDNQTTGEEIHISERDAEKQLSPDGQPVQMGKRDAPMNPAEDAPKHRRQLRPQEQKEPEKEQPKPQQSSAEPFQPQGGSPVSHIPQDIPTSAAPGGTAEKLFDRAAAEHDAHKARQAARMSRDAAQQRYSASRLQFSEEERAAPELRKHIHCAEKAADKLDAAQAAIPKKRVLRKERVFDEASGTVKTKLRFDTLVCLDLFFVFLAWVAYPGDFLNLVGLMIFVSFVALVIPFACAIHRRSKIDTAFRRFLLEPDDTNEYLLCESTPASMHTYIHELAHHLRTQLEYVNEQQLKITDYESYIENWVHEIKKPLSLMTLLLDNRKDEMSPLVHTRMLYVRDHTRQNVEQILYFSRLGAVHKDYYFEPLPILETCKEAVEDNLSLLEEAHFSVTYSGNNCTAISDKKGFMFILGQIISNSVKYAAHDATPAIHFSVSDNKEIGQIVLSICDNGTGIPASDLPFVFDKGFTGDVGSYLSRSTGMGLYLVQQMASDLTIKIDIHSNTNGGTTVILTFPKVERPLGR